MAPIFHWFHSLLFCFFWLVSNAEGGRHSLDTSSRCGHWHSHFTNLQYKMEHGRKQPRYVVHVTWQSGLADRLVGVVSSFYFAMLTNRAFKIVTVEPGFASFHDIYHSPHIHWQPDESLIDKVRDIILNDVPHQGYKFYNWHHWYQSGGNQSFEWPQTFREINLTSLDTGDAYLVVKSNRGTTSLLFDNSYHSDFLYGIGLRPETAFGCVTEYLFRPKPQTLHQYQEDLDKLENRQILKIGIQIRHGDEVFDRDSKSGGQTIEEYARYFSCAEEIERDHALNGQEVLWVLLSDSLTLRKAAIKRYGEKILTWVNEPTRHVSLSTDPDENLKGLQSIAAEHWLLSLTDFQVISSASGIGRTAALMAMKSNRVYYPGGDEGDCGDGRFRPIYDLMKDYSWA